MLNHLFDRVTLVALATLLGCVLHRRCRGADRYGADRVEQAGRLPKRAGSGYGHPQGSKSRTHHDWAVSRSGRITLKPPAPELVQAVVEASAYKALASRSVAEPQTVLCGIRVFEIATPATPLYWDINAKIELVLRVRGQDRTVSGTATERTFAWPTEALIERVTTEALRQVSAESEQALETLFALPR